MRLTTRLMQIASWLLLQRAANSGEMTRSQVASEKAKVHLDTASAQEVVENWVELPFAFRQLVERSLRLQSLVRRMDEEIYGLPAPSARRPRLQSRVRSDHLAEDGLRTRLRVHLRGRKS